MDNKSRKLTGIAIFTVAIAATTIVYAKAINEPRVEPVPPAEAPKVATSNNFMVVEGDSIYLLKDESLMVFDRTTLEVKQSKLLNATKAVEPQSKSTESALKTPLDQ